MTLPTLVVVLAAAVLLGERCVCWHCDSRKLILSLLFGLTLARPKLFMLFFSKKSFMRALKAASSN